MRSVGIIEGKVFGMSEASEMVHYKNSSPENLKNLKLFFCLHDRQEEILNWMSRTCISE